MIATFLRAEIDSARYGERIRAILARHGTDPERFLEDPAYCRRLPEEHRAYERGEGLFLGLPDDLEWFRAALEPHEVLDILYIDWDWLLPVSGGTRRPRDAARLLRAGEIAGVDVSRDRPIVSAPELIAVTNTKHSPVVVMEGHVRLTAYALFPESLPDELEILLGVSERIAEWANF